MLAKSWLCWHGFSESLIPSSRISIGPGPRDTAPPLSLHVHVPPACRHLWFSPVEKVTKQSSPESWPAYLVSSRLISQLVQGRADTVKSITTQFGHWWFIRYKQIYCHYTSNFYHIIGENYSFYSLRSRNSHFHHINPAKYHIFHIYTICKLFKNSRKQHISYLLKNHCFWHFSIFLSFLQICQNHPISGKPKKHHFLLFPHTMTTIRFSPFLPNSPKCPKMPK